MGFDPQPLDRQSSVLPLSYHRFPYRNPYSYLIFVSTRNHTRSQYLPVPVLHFFPYENLKIRVRIGVRVMVRVGVVVMVRDRGMVSVRHKYDSRTGKWKTDTGRY